MVPLSEREIQVLRMLSTELSGPQVARELFVSLKTLRTHTMRIFDKLSVNNRVSAVRPAREAGLL
jgi:LuxR family maltose regulon positive regulatory protein